jgi:histidinol-phosphate aminotransferase
MAFDLGKIIKSHIKDLKVSVSPRDEYRGKLNVFLDSNENPFGLPAGHPNGRLALNRYPDPEQLALKEKLSKVKGLPVENIFLGNGSDEAIDILFRAFCESGVDNVIICPPIYERYETYAHLHEINVIKVPLTPGEFQLNTEHIIQTIDKNTKLIFLCCPNNPTGNGVKWDSIKAILKDFSGIVVIDEAYIDFASYRSLIPELMDYPNIVILQTLSEAWGMAGLRIGMVFASELIINVFKKIKPPYNISSVSQQLALEVLDDIEKINDQIKTIVEEREKLSLEISALPFVLKVYPSETNFIVVKVADPNAIYNYLISKKILIRDISQMELCEGCLRITVGTKHENKLLSNALKEYEQ